MRSIFYLVMTLLVLQLFFPLLSGQLEDTLLAVFQLLENAFSSLSVGDFIL